MRLMRSVPGRAPSLRWRLLGGMAAVAVLFLSAAGIVLDRAFQASAARAAAEKLDVYLLALVGIAEVNGATVEVPTALLDARFARPHSGLYGAIVDGRGAVRWRSASTAGQDLSTGLGPLLRVAPGALGTTRRDEADALGFGHVFRSAMTVVFGAPGGGATRYTFVAALSRDAVVAEVSGFRGTLWAGLGVVGLLLMLAEALLFRAIAAPLTRLARRVEAIERGETTAFGAGWPVEVAGVTANLDRFIAQERQLLERYRTLTDDLAHSLKTPLAVLRNAVDDPANDLVEARQVLQDQVARMQTVLDARLDRVVVQPVLARTLTPTGAALDELLAALRRLYPEHRLELKLRGAPRFPGAARDLTELAGNLCDNACKYGRTRVQVTAAEEAGAFVLVVEDDGPGVALAVRPTILHRGVRADTRASGQGIGLAVVRQLLDAYQGGITIDTSAELGGACFTLRIPLNPAAALQAGQPR